MNKTFEILKIGLLAIIAVCLMIIAYQGFNSTQDVYVQGGDLNAKVRGEVSVDGYVSVGNTVDVNLDKVLGYPIGCHRSYIINGKEYQAIDVYQSNNW